MSKLEFLEALRPRLGFMSEAEAQKTLQFYSEMIDDRVEDGMSEQEAVESLGSIDGMIEEIKNSIPTEEPSSDGMPKKGRSKTLWIVLSICGFPVWVPLAAAALVVLLAFYICVMAVTASLFIIVPCFAAVALAALVGGVFNCAAGSITTGIALIGSGLSLAGLSIMSAKPLWWLCRELILLIPKSFKFIIRLFKNNRRKEK